MSHSRGLFQSRCPGNFKKYGKKNLEAQTQQYRCSRCGRLKIQSLTPCLFGLHTWPMNKRVAKGHQVRCKTCGTPRRG